MDLSYWELKNWFANVDYTIVGSGIVGLHAALRLREKYPKSKILILEKGALPQGASTKNAGFACFGSVSEILDDLNRHSESEVFDLVQKRWNGLQILRKNLGDAVIDFKQYGGYELFLEDQKEVFENCLSRMEAVNKLLFPIFEKNVFFEKNEKFGFKNISKTMIFNPFEGQLDTGNMMQALLKKAVSKNILILNRQNVLHFEQKNQSVQVQLEGFQFETKKILFATNGFASKLTNNAVQPGRAQCLITSSINNLKIKGTFHLDKGYFYFRNIGNQILIGGGRNLNFETEKTTTFGQTPLVQNHLELLLKNVILPETDFTIAHRWSGIMGLGESKNPIVKQLSEDVYCGVRLGGMGVAIGSLVGKELADLV